MQRLIEELNTLLGDEALLVDAVEVIETQLELTGGVGSFGGVVGFTNGWIGVVWTGIGSASFLS